MAVSLKPSLSSIATDPFRNFKFRVVIHHPGIRGFATMGFMAVSGLSITTEVIPYREGGIYFSSGCLLRQPAWVLLINQLGVSTLPPHRRRCGPSSKDTSLMN